MTYPISAFPSSPWRTQSVDAPRAIESHKVYVDARRGNDDSGSGALQSPVRSIGRGLTLAREKGNGKSRMSIVIRGGDYYLSEPVLVDRAGVDDGLIITAYEDESVFIRGTRPFHPRWENASEYVNVIKTSIPAEIAVDWNHFNELFIGAERSRGVRARYPNGDSFVNLMEDATWTQDFRWGSERRFDNAEIVEVAVGRDDYYENYRMGFNGPAVVFTPPQSFWAFKNKANTNAYNLPNSANINGDFNEPR